MALFLAFVLLPMLIIIYEKGLHLFAAVNIFTFFSSCDWKLQPQITRGIQSPSCCCKVATLGSFLSVTVRAGAFRAFDEFKCCTLWCHSRGRYTFWQPRAPNWVGPPTESEPKCVLCSFIFSIHFYFVLKQTNKTSLKIGYLLLSKTSWKIEIWYFFSLQPKFQSQSQMC